MEEPLRKIERLDESGWTVIRMQDIKLGTIFRATEPDEEHPMFYGISVADATFENGVWCIDAHMFVEER